MSFDIDETHAPELQSWVESANAAACDFPVQNLPFGRFRSADQSQWRIGVAIGNQLLDLQRAGLIETQDMHQLMGQPVAARQALRLALSRGLRRHSAQEEYWRAALLPQSAVQLGLPCDIGDYTDFYTGIHHATAVGKLLRPDAPLLPNYKWMPIAYHGRASSICVSGHGFHRPCGQFKLPNAEQAVDGPCQRLDFELELGIMIGQPNALGAPIPMSEAPEHVFGLVLFNDWSARDIQAWEYQPLGPFLSKNFASTLSPWVVTLEALSPFRRAFSRPAVDPAPLPYLDSPGNRLSGALDIGLEAWLQTAAMREAGHAGDRLARSNFAESAYWTVAQMVAHHTVNGCNLSTGDLLGTGTLSGPQQGQEGCLLEKTQGGKKPVLLSNGESRTFLEDGDAITLRACCEREGFRRIGFGSCTATVLPARPMTRS